MTTYNEKLEKLRNKEEQIKSQIKDIKQIQKQKNKDQKDYMNLLLGRTVSQAIDDGLLDSHKVREILRQYIVNPKDKVLFKI